jgi:cell division protein ZapA
MTELSIKLRIGSREYPMRVKAEDEERIRRAGKILNEKMKSYREKFGIEDQQDLLAMVAFDCQVEKMKNEESKITTDEHSLNQVMQLNQLISQAI